MFDFYANLYIVGFGFCHTNKNSFLPNVIEGVKVKTKNCISQELAKLDSR